MLLRPCASKQAVEKPIIIFPDCDIASQLPVAVEPVPPRAPAAGFRLLNPLEHRGDALTTPDAHGFESEGAVLPNQFPQQRGEYPYPGSPDRMA